MVRQAVNILDLLSSAFRFVTPVTLGLLYYAYTQDMNHLTKDIQTIQSQLNKYADIQQNQGDTLSMVKYRCCPSERN